MKDVNGCEHKMPKFLTWGGFYALFTGVEVEHISESDSNVIFKFIVSDTEYLYPINYTCQNIHTTGKMDFLYFCVEFFGDEDSVDESADLNELVDCYCMVDISYVDECFTVKSAMVEEIIEGREADSDDIIYEEFPYESGNVPDEVNTYLRELLGQKELRDNLYQYPKKADKLRNDDDDIDDFEYSEEFFADIDDIELI